ncbi:YciI family protein [Salsipaludibacter albus]|uniref:YciI family protein n=1 Tax=Salsipaludibacter albus TaxID=2849650 RepID=UPI001EE49B96|nr:YciI family protein [Salsipaludibacter albus]
MTQYLLSVHHEGLDFPEVADEDLQRQFAQVDTFNTDLQASGRWVFAGGLEPPSTATVVESRAGEVVSTDGPFAEAKEYMGGFWVIEAADLDEAMALAADASTACEAPVEVRPFQGE